MRQLICLFTLCFIPLYTSAQPVEQSFEGITFVKIQGEPYISGSSLNQGHIKLNETPRVIPITHSFWMSKYEVSQGEWMSVMGSNPSTFKQLSPDMTAPVETITWYQAWSFIDKLNQNAGGDYFRLPTEAEWEYVARAETPYDWSFGTLSQHLNLYAHRDGLATPRPRGFKQLNRLGVYDLYVNVYEWCED